MAADYAIWDQPAVGEVDFDDLKLFVGPKGLNDPVASNEFAELVLQSHTNNEAKGRSLESE